MCSRDELSLRCTHWCVIVINYESTTHQAKRPTNSLSPKLLTPSINSGSPNTPPPAAFLWASSVAVFADLRVALLRPCLIEFGSDVVSTFAPWLIEFGGNVVSTRSFFVSRQHLSQTFSVLNFFGSAMIFGQLWDSGADAKRPISPAGRFCGGNRARAAQLRQIMVNSAKT